MTAQHGIAGLLFHDNASVQHRALRDRAWFQIGDFERHLAADVRQGSEMEGEDYADHSMFTSPGQFPSIHLPRIRSEIYRAF